MFRNKEVGQFVMGFVGITLISALTGFIIHWIAGMLAIVSGRCLWHGVFYIYQSTIS